MKFSNSDPVVWLIYLVCFLLYPLLSSLGQHIGIDKDSIWIRFGFVRCIRISREQEIILINLKYLIFIFQLFCKIHTKTDLSVSDCSGSPIGEFRSVT